MYEIVVRKILTITITPSEEYIAVLWSSKRKEFKEQTLDGRQL